MPCYKPIQAVRVHENHERFWTKNGKFKLWFGKQGQEYLSAFGDRAEILMLPCAKCVGCLNRRSCDWGVRCYHEMQFWDKGSFLTLTYDRAHLPPNRSLVKKDLQDFWKRLRMELSRKHGIREVRYFACGEYGEVKGRPHYHALLFGFDFPDRVRIENNPGASDPLYESEMLTRIWGMGKATFGIDVGGKSAVYVAKYAAKKVYGEKGKVVYAGTGRIPPFNCMSHGIGRRWFDRYKSDLYPGDFVVSEDRGSKLPVPRRYDTLLGEISEEYLEWIKMRRVAKRVSNPEDETIERMAVRELCALKRAEAASQRRLEKRVSQNESGTGGAI